MFIDQPLRESDVFSHDFHCNSGKRRKEKRRFRRFRCKKKIMVFWDRGYGMIQDISLGGLSLLSPILKDKNSDTGIIKGERVWTELLLGLEKIRVANLSSEIIYKYDIPFSVKGFYQNCYRKRCGLSFTGLSNRQLYMTKSMILKGTFI
ncbi:MAG: hypothetical protein ACLFV2_06155 [Desulfurivibrionaceae bacterium]